MTNWHFIKSIMYVFTKHPSQQITIRELSKQAKLTYNATHRTVQELLKQNILLQQKYGNVCVLQVQNNSQGINALAAAAYEKARKLKNIEEYQNIKLQKGILSIIHTNHKAYAISEIKKSEEIAIDTKKISLLTIHELLAEISTQKSKKNNLDFTIIKGAEYLFEKLLDLP